MYLTANPTVGALASASVALQQGPTLLNAAPTVSAANSPVTITLTGVAGQRITLRALAIKATGAAVAASVTVQDGATVVLDLGVVAAVLGGAATVFTGSPLLTGSAGNNVVINVGAGGALAITTTSVIADRQ